jgi:putative transposase
MARLPRLSVPGLPHSVLQQVGRGHAWVVDDDDRGFFLECLQRAAVEHAVNVHAYVLLDDRWQLLCTPLNAQALSLMMQAVGRAYVARFNRRHARSGPLWAGRFRATVIDPARVVSAMVALETEPQRRGLAGQAADWPWSSLAHHLGQGHAAWLADAAQFWSLGNTPFERQAHYLRLVQSGVAASEVGQLERHTLSGWAWGGESFVAQLEALGARRPSPRPRGRPRKGAQPAA